MQQVSVSNSRSNRKPMPLRVSKIKHSQKVDVAGKQVPNVEIPPLRVVPSNEPAVVSPRILQALKEDSDASESLSDIRGLLLGPVMRLHEARIEELLAIFEEADRGNRQAVQDLNARGDQLMSLCEKNHLSIVQTNDALRATAAQQQTDLVNAIQNINDTMKDMFQRAEANLQHHSSALNDRVSNLAARTAEDHQTILAYFTKRIDELEAATKASDEQNLLKLENQLAKYAADMKAEEGHQLNTIAEGFAEFSSRVLALRAGRPIVT